MPGFRSRLFDGYGRTRTAIIVGAVLAGGACAAAAQPDLGKTSARAAETTVEWVCATYPARIQALWESLDLAGDGLGKVRAAVARGDSVGGCYALLDYYRQGTSGRWLRGPDVPPGSGHSDAADAILNDTFTFYQQSARVPRAASGGLTWTHRGPANDWEWTLALNRHDHLRLLMEAYRETGNSDYPRRIDEHLRDWIRASLPYPARKNVGDLWRGLEISFRAKVWAQLFYGLQQDANFTPAARLLVLTSLPDHAHHLRHFHGVNNWRAIELSALGLIAAAWPEYRDAGEWREYASTTLTRELQSQIYPDGAQHELASGYHLVALRNFEQFADVCDGAGIALPQPYRAGLEKMWNYLAFTIRPDGHSLLNNDSELEYNRERVLQAAAKYGRPDWAYVASQGTQGKRPDLGPSLVFPWAGQLVARGGWGPNDLWSFFDVGPWGTGHQHNDKLHVSVSAHGRDLLVDSGRFVYSGDNARFRREYAVLSRAHNVILIDGQGQAPGPRVAREPLSTNDYAVTPTMTFARASCDHFDALGGRAVHTRAVVHHLANGLIVVADRIDSDRARRLETLWHWHPRCTVAVNGQALVSTDKGQGNLRIVPVSEHDWTIRLVKGQQSPHLQGWYSRQYNVWEPNTAAVLSADVGLSAAFAWLLLVARGEVAEVRGEIIGSDTQSLKMRIHLPGDEELGLRIPWRKGAPTLEN